MKTPANNPKSKQKMAAKAQALRLNLHKRKEALRGREEGGEGLLKEALQEASPKRGKSAP